MKQKEVKLPFTCSEFGKAVFFVWFAATLLTLFFYEFNELHVVSFAGLGIISFMWWTTRAREGKETFPFRFSCKCEDD